MKDTFAATAISRTNRAEDSTLELELADADGRLVKVRVTADIALGLAQMLKEFADRSAQRFEHTLTKMPKTFSVGAGRFDNVVLIRFEDDAPYALAADDAMELGEALLEQSESVGLRPAKVFQ